MEQKVIRDVRSSTLPNKIEFTTDSVFIASNIQPYEEIYDERTVSGYKYDLIQYPKNDYISELAEKNSELEAALLDTQVALCDIYEMIGGLE